MPFITYFIFLPVDRCNLPVSVGVSCSVEPSDRWYFDGSICRSFFYNGCDGNANNFMTQGLCQAACPGGGGRLFTIR